MLAYYIDGLLVITERIEHGDLSETVVIRGSSYFFSEQSARRLGFEVSTTSIWEKLNIMINYLDLLWMYSLAHDAIKFPDLGNIKTASISGGTLLQHQEDLLKIKAFLESHD